MMDESPTPQPAATDPPPQANESNNLGSSATNGVSLYTLLGVERTATQAQIRKSVIVLFSEDQSHNANAARRAIVKHMKRLHPDREENRDDPEANEKFTDFVAMVDILEDPVKRRKYDESGQAEGIESLTKKINRLTM